MVYSLLFSLSLSLSLSSKCSLFHNSNVFGSCIIHTLYTGVLKFKKKNNSGAKRLNAKIMHLVLVTATDLSSEPVPSSCQC